MNFRPLATLTLALSLFPLGPTRCAAQRDQPNIGSSTSRLHNGWRLTPAGKHQKVGEMLLAPTLSPDRTLIAVVNAGYNAHHLYLLDAQSGQVRQTFPLSRAWNGVAWSRNGKSLYVSGGGAPRIYVFTQRGDGSYAPAPSLALPDLAANPPEEKGPPQKEGQGQAYVSGLAVSQDGRTLYAANFATDTIYALNLQDGTVRLQRKLEPNAHPYCLRLRPDGESLYVTQGALHRVVVLKTADLSTTRTIATESHPNDLLFAPDGRLFVSCGNSDCVLVIDPSNGQTLERLAVKLTPNAPAGATPEALALSPNGKTLYIAASDDNAVAVADISQPNASVIRGFIPTGWYPTGVCVAPDGQQLHVFSGKGMGLGPSAPPGKDLDADNTKRGNIYGPTLLSGIISTLPIPDDAKLAAYTRQTLDNTPYRDEIVAQPAHAPRPGSNAIPSRLGDPSPLKHVLYIIKENRTYDQVMGDIKEGNGDPKLTLFGAKVTPNIHALARQYVLLDNLYCNGDVSGNGHPWSTAAYETDIGERSWMLTYGGHAEWSLTDLDVFPPVGRIWDLCDARALTYASYYWTWTTDNTLKNMPKVWEEGLKTRRDYENAAVFQQELKRYEQNNNLPSFMIMSLREDHTEGTTPGSYTPTACVASNDLAVGKIVEACSHSKFWPQMAIFIIEDDGQDGPDHVDAHRTEALVISPYTRHKRVDSSFYTTTSMLRTMELILGLPPMSQYDAAASPMYTAFDGQPDNTPFTALPPQVDIMTKSAQTAYGAQRSRQMNFVDPDQLSEDDVEALNHILWHSIKGANVPYPTPTRSALFNVSGRPLTLR